MSNAQLPLVPLKELSTFVDKQPVTAIEGTLASLYEVETKNKKTGADLPYPKQNAVLKAPDGTEHRIAFAAEMALPMSMRGKKIRISSTIGTHGMTGMKMDRYNSDAKYHYVSITKSANIEEVGASTGQPVQQRPASAQQASPRPQVPETHVELDGEPMPTNEPMEDRIDAWLKTYDLVCQALGYSREEAAEILKALTPDKVAEITTGMICSFKGKYATHARPHFRPDRQVQATIAKTDALIERAKAATAEPAGWKNYVYNGIRLGDHSEEKLVEMIQWAETTDLTTPEARALKTQLLAAKAERDSTDPSKQFYREGEDSGEIPF